MFDHGEQSKLRDCTERADVCFPSRKHWGLESTVQKLRLRSISGGLQQGTDMVPGLHTRKVSCVYTQGWLRAHRSKRRIWFSPVKPALMLLVRCHNIILLPLEKML